MGRGRPPAAEWQGSQDKERTTSVDDTPAKKTRSIRCHLGDVMNSWMVGGHGAQRGAQRVPGGAEAANGGGGCAHGTVAAVFAVAVVVRQRRRAATREATRVCRYREPVKESTAG